METTIHIYTVEIITPNIFGEMERYENTYEVYDFAELQHNVFEWYGENEFTVLNHEVLETV